MERILILSTIATLIIIILIIHPSGIPLVKKKYEGHPVSN